MKHLLILALLLSFSCPLSAADEEAYKTAMAAAETGQYGQAFDLFFELNQQGDPRGAHNIGVIYEQGLGLTANIREAANWYRLAADGGVAAAQYNLARLLEEGRGVQQSFSDAAAYYRMAADQGLAEAQFNLAVLYQNGQGVKKNLTTALGYFKQASEQGNADATYNIALLYDRSPEVADPAAAVTWYEEAARKGHIDAQYNLAICYYEGRGVPVDNISAYAWLSVAAKAGNTRAREAQDGLTQELSAEQRAEAQKKADQILAK